MCSLQMSLFQFYVPDLCCINGACPSPINMASHVPYLSPTSIPLYHEKDLFFPKSDLICMKACLHPAEIIKTAPSRSEGGRVQASGGA